MGHLRSAEWFDWDDGLGMQGRAVLRVVAGTPA